MKVVVKRSLPLLLAVIMIFSLAACGAENSSNNSAPSTSTDDRQSSADKERSNSTDDQKPSDSALVSTDSTPPDPAEQGARVLVAYFSATGTTKALAEYAADALRADIYEIVPDVPYTEDDLKYYTDCRADREQNDPSCRPEIRGKVDDISEYDIIFVAYPIWHGQAPKIIYTFLESYDLSGKTIVPFCTSGSSPIGSSAQNLHVLCPSDTVWLGGARLKGDASRADIVTWINGLGLDVTAE